MALFIAGDGMAREDGNGWGTYLKERLAGAAIYNAAAEGASSRSFLAEAKLQEPEERMKEGDVLLIQFGRNDASAAVWKHTDPLTSYMNCLSIFVDTARTWGTVPVLATQVPENTGNAGDYPPAVEVLGRRMHVPVIDVYAQGREAMEKMGEKEAAALFAGEEQLTEKGRVLFGEMIYEGLKKLNLLPGKEAAEEAEAASAPAAAAWRTEEGGN